MEKTLTIDGKQVTFKSTGATPLRYKQQFGKAFFAEIAKMSKGSSKNFDLAKLDMEAFYNIAWVFAKTADKTIPEPLEWLDRFESFPILEIIPDLQDMLLGTMQTKKKQMKKVRKVENQSLLKRTF